MVARVRSGRASASLAISGAADMSAINCAVNASPSGAGLMWPLGDNGQLGVVVSDNTKDRTRASSAW